MTKTHCSVAQGFGGNATATYKNGGLLGHTGVDSSCNFGSEIKALWGNEYVYKVLTKENPSNDGTGFTGVFTIVDNGIETFEFLYGHCNPTVSVGQILALGEVLGTEANNGEVYSGGTRITLDMQKNGDTRGSHRHDQKRILTKHKIMLQGFSYLTDNNGAFTKDGCYYAISYHKNGYAGCVNWTLPLITRDLFFGCVGYDVLVLQRILKKLGFLKIDECTDFFGPMTMRAVTAFQKAHGIAPALGYCGKITRAALLNLI